MTRCIFAVAVFVLPAVAADPTPKDQVTRVVASVGGPDKLLTTFRMKERLAVSADPAAKGSDRTSILQPPKYWFVGKRERVAEEKEPATFLVWAWTLGALVDASSKVEVIADITENEKPAFGLRVSQSINPPMDLYFDKETARLVRIDWRADIHRFSSWKEVDGCKYPSECIGYKKATNKRWYATQIIEIERLKELPAELKKK